MKFLLVNLHFVCIISVVSSDEFNGDKYPDDDINQFALLGGVWWYYYKNTGESKFLKTGNTLTEDVTLEVRIYLTCDTACFKFVAFLIWFPIYSLAW